MTSFQTSMGGAIRQKGLDESSYFGQAFQRLPAIMANSPIKALTIITVVNIAIGIFIVLGMYAYNNYWRDREKKEPEIKEGHPIYKYIPDVLVFLSVGGINCILATIVKVQLNAFLVLSITACSFVVAMVKHFISIKILQDNKKNIELLETKELLIGEKNQKGKLDEEKKKTEVQRDLLKKQLDEANQNLEEERSKITQQEKLIAYLKSEVNKLQDQVERLSKTGPFGKSTKSKEAASKGTPPLTAERAYGSPDARGQAQSDASGTRTEFLREEEANFQKGLPSPTSSRFSALPVLKSRTTPSKEANAQKNGGSSTPASQVKATGSLGDRIVNFISAKDGNGDIPSSPYNMMDLHK